jgi:hypothetical protein
METRPLASILFVNVETKRSIPQLTKFVLLLVTWPWRLPFGDPAAAAGKFRFGRPARGTRVDRKLVGLALTTLLAESRPSGPASSPVAGSAERSRRRQLRKGPWRSLGFGPSNQTPRPATVSCPVRTGTYGIAWDLMVVNGLLRIFCGAKRNCTICPQHGCHRFSRFGCGKKRKPLP